MYNHTQIISWFADSNLIYVLESINSNDKSFPDFLVEFQCLLLRAFWHLNPVIEITSACQFCEYDFVNMTSHLHVFLYFP